MKISKEIEWLIFALVSLPIIGGMIIFFLFAFPRLPGPARKAFLDAVDILGVPAGILILAVFILVVYRASRKRGKRVKEKVEKVAKGEPYF